MNACQVYVSHEIDGSKELVSDFNFSKMHVMSHWLEQIHWYRPSLQYSTESHEQAHAFNLNDDWNASHLNLNNLPQEINFKCHTLPFEIRELNLQAMPQLRENSASAVKVLHSGPDMATPRCY